MILKNKYVIGCLVMFYEIKIFEEYVQSILNATEGIENPENIVIDLMFNISEYLEEIDTSKITQRELIQEYNRIVSPLRDRGFIISSKIRGNSERFYNVADYRRDLNADYCNYVDFIMWGETDSLWPEQTFVSIESVAEMAEENNIRRYCITFGYRKMWDDSWRIVEHPKFENEKFSDDPEWMNNNPASPKSYMTIEQMNEINSEQESLDIRVINEPKFDGSCLVIATDVIKNGVNIPPALLLCAEDTGFLWMIRKILGNNYRQFIVKNILRVHNRRHPQKRLYIKDENNPKGFCGPNDKTKRNHWKQIEEASKANLAMLDAAELHPKFLNLKNIIEGI